MMMRRGNVKGVAGRTKPSRSVGAAVKLHAAVASAHLEGFMAASVAAETSAAESADRRPPDTAATPASPEVEPPEAKARGPPRKSSPRGDSTRPTQKN